MAYEPGGYADKLGNRYELRWVVRQMLRLLAERLKSIQVESAGEDADGVDLWITRLDGTREAQQCKGENGNKANWSIKDLGGRNVLYRLRQQLERDPTARFAFISSTPANELRDLTRSARDSNGDPQSFYDHQIQAVSQARKKAFKDFCDCLGIDEKSSFGQQAAFELLRRSDFHLFSDDRELQEELELIACQLVVGDAEAVLGLLAKYAQDHPRKLIIASDLRSYLTQSGFEPRSLLADTRIAPKLEELKEDFNESIQPFLAGSKLIPRKEVEQLLEALQQEESVDVVVLHGEAGQGKSGVLFEFCSKLTDLELPFLAIRLDIKTAVSSTREFGKKLGLPDSPVKSLCDVSGDRHCILIIDQLDALRWTSAHASEGIDMCKALVREVQANRKIGRRVSIVFSCRTYDLENDRQIATWLKESSKLSLMKVKVEALPKELVVDWTAEFHQAYNQLTLSRKELLRCVQNLALWLEVMSPNNSPPEFDSITDLLHAFWENRRQKIEEAGCSSNDLTQVLDNIIGYMEKNSSLSAPRFLIDDHQKIATELQTLNVIHFQGSRISFSHQSHVDFHIALRTLRRLYESNGNILNWLGDKSQQPLFRREQLRHLLFLRANDDIAKFIDDLKLLVSSTEVRFHIKQLAIEVIGQSPPKQELQDFIRSYLDWREWRKHVVRYVFHKDERWIEAIHDSGQLRKMLLSDDEYDYGHAAWLLISVANRLPRVIDSVLDTVIKAGVEDRMFNYLLHSDVESETECVFQFRLSMIKKVEEPPYVHWEKVAKARPDRALKLLAEFLKDFGSGSHKTRVARRLDMNRKTDHKAICDAVKRFPKRAIRLLGPILYKLAKRKIKEWTDWKDRQQKKRFVSPSTKYPEVLIRAFRSALIVLARREPKRFLEVSRRFENLSSRSVQALLVRGWASLPEDLYADLAIQWLLTDRRRLRCGSARREPRWCEAARLIRRMSPTCSRAVFLRLEEALLKYRDPDEKKKAEAWLSWTRDGYYFNGFGAAKHFLLSALASDRRNECTTERIEVLQEKFAGYPDGFFLSTGLRGGNVRSPLEPDAIRHMSDKRWLELIQNQGIPDRNARQRKWKHKDNSLLESSVEMFSRDFRIAATREPERFGRLALRFTCDTPASYLAEVFAAFEQQEPLNDTKEDLSQCWQPATPEIIHQVLESAELGDDNYLMRRLCWLLLRRSDLEPSEKVISRLIELTNLYDPGYDPPDKIRPQTASKKREVYHFENIVLNHIRALAVSTIGAVVRRNERLFVRFSPCLEAALLDPHPSVRMAIVGLCPLVWKFDKQLAVDWFMKSTDLDLWAACGRYAQHFLNCAFPEFTEQLTPRIKAMVDSTEPSISEEGAQEVFARWLFFGVFDDMLQACRSGKEHQRKGVVKVAAHFVTEKEYSAKCLSVLEDSCNDTDEEIREITAGVFQHGDFWKLPNTGWFVERFIESKAFADDPIRLFWSWEGYTGSLLPFANGILAASHRIKDFQLNPNHAPEFRRGLWGQHLCSVVLRLYDQANSDQHAKIRNHCLDAIDDMLLHLIAPVVDQLELMSK